MTAPTLVQPGIAEIWRSLRGAAVGLALGLVTLGLLFHAEVTAAVHTWIVSTAYNHCFLVIPIALYLIWDRRETLRGAAAEPMPLLALAGVPLAIGWLLAERLGIMEGRQLIAMSFVELLFLAVLGWRFWWLLAGPLLYLYFLVPFGDFLTPKLQDYTTIFIRYGLDVVNIPAYIDGYTIEIPEGTFYVAEACAGLRFLIASIAFGCLYALLMYRSPMRRAGFIVASIIVPIIANWFRALGIVALGHILGSAEAAAADHVLYGWIFFSLVILLLIALGLPFREDNARSEPTPMPDAAPPPPALSVWRGALVAFGIVAALAAVSPALALALNYARVAEAGSLALDLGPGCTATPASLPLHTEVPGRMVIRHVTCEGIAFEMNIEVLPRHSTAAPLVAEQRRLATIPDAEEVEGGWLPRAPDQPRLWRVAKVPQRGPMVVYAMLVDGRPAPSALAMRVRMAWSSVVGARVAPVLITIVPEVEWPKLTVAARDAVETQLAALLLRPDVVAQLERLGADGR